MQSIHVTAVPARNMTTVEEVQKHGLAARDAERPSSSDWTIPQAWEQYTAVEHATWKTLYERQAKLLAGRACDEFIAGMASLPISAEAIPDFRALNDVLMKRTGWRVVAVPGLVPDDVFFDHLSNRRFPSGNFIRKPEHLDYLEEPDVFHDIFGHVPMLMNPAIADFIQAYGIGGLRAQKLGELSRLARVYWYTVEFGLVEQRNGLRLYGAGIASSFTESLFCLDCASPNRIRLRLERVMRTQYRIDDLQETYFVIRSLDELLEFTQIDFAPLYELARGLKDLSPGDVLSTDEVLGHRDGSYHIARRQGEAA